MMGCTTILPNRLLAVLDGETACRNAEVEITCFMVSLHANGGMRGDELSEKAIARRDHEMMRPIACRTHRTCFVFSKSASC